MRLNQENLKFIKNIKSKPNYNPQQSRNNIVHFGVGNFHRAHQAFFIHEMLNNNQDTSIIGINLRSDQTRKNLQKQNNFYSIYECSSTDINIHILNPYKKLLFGLEDKEEICAYISNSEIKIITVTVTEKGYHYNPIDNCLDFNDEIKNDLENSKIKTLVGHLSYGLIERYKKNKKELYILSCDNLSNNGDILKKVIYDFVYQIDKNVALWIEETVKFPCTMVDCIVPNTKRIPIEIGQQFNDNSLVLCEPYRDWYIESNSDFLKKALTHKRIKFVNNVEFYENIKLKILNASHTALAYLGLLLGYKYVHEAINDELCNKFINEYLDYEVIPTIENENNFNIINYKNEILKRFRNKFLNHKLEQIGMDGSLKIPIRIIDTYNKRIKNTKYVNTSLIISCWILIFKRKNMDTFKYVVSDPISEDLMQLVNSKDNYIKAIIEMKNIFDVSEKSKLDLLKNISFQIKKIEELNLSGFLSYLYK